MRLSPLAICRGLSTFRYFRADPSRLTPASCSRNRKGALLPSMIGTSRWLSSTTTLSMPEATSAASRCSTVSTVAPSRPSTVAYCTAETLSTEAGISMPRSVRRNRIPVSAAAGLSVRVTFCPECKSDAGTRDLTLEGLLDVHSPLDSVVVTAGKKANAMPVPSLSTKS